MKKHYAATIIFCGFLLISAAANVLSPARGFSENENRHLAQPPVFTVERLFSGAFADDVTKYINDQFYLRDAWVSLKALSESAMGKTDINGVYIGKGGFLSEMFRLEDNKQFDRNVAIVNEFAGLVNIPVYFTLIPGAGEIWADKLPSNAQNTVQKALTLSAGQDCGSAIYVDSYTPLYERRGKEIYFNTDHHWTTFGAHVGYAALAEAMGFEAVDYPVPWARLKGFYGTASSKSGLRPGPGDTVELAVRQQDILRVSILEDSGWREGAMYDMSFADKKDKYSVFFGGNFPVMRIDAVAEGPKLLYVKDSYANALLPFLTAHFSQIHVIDLRFCKLNVREYIESEGIDMAVVSYSVPKFAVDTNIYVLTR